MPADRQLAAARRLLGHVAVAADLPLSVRLWDGSLVPLGRDAPAAVAQAVAGSVPAAQRRQRGDRDLIQFHYDASNAFYALFLDPLMVYSCAYFTDWEASLEEAQVAKLDLICRKLRPRPGERFLDIGCGWGALVCHAARHYGVHAHGVTLSKAQPELARERITRAGLAGRVEVELRDYRQLDGNYDKIASVGMYEHVGIANGDAYFRKIRDLLAQGGAFLNHGITRRAKRDRTRFHTSSPSRRIILKYILPGAELDHIGHTIEAMEVAGSEVQDVEGLRYHYARTTRLWHDRLAAAKAAAIAEVGPERYRMWLAYLAGVSAAFADGPIRIYQTVATKQASGPPPSPPTRDDIYRPAAGG